MTSKNPYTKLFNSFKKLINLVEAEKFKGDSYNRTFKIILYRSVREYLDFVVSNTGNNTTSAVNTTNINDENSGMAIKGNNAFYSIPILDSYLQDCVIAELSSAVKEIFLHAGKQAAMEYLNNMIGGFIPDVEVEFTNLSLFFSYAARIKDIDVTEFAGGEGGYKTGCLEASKWLESLIGTDEKRAELRDRVYKACVESMRK